MKHVNDFLLEISKLKRIPRMGWVLMGVKTPETVAEHSFGLAMASWVFAHKKRLKPGKAIKLALAHDLCEVYAGDITTLLYHPEFRQAKTVKERKVIEMKWARLSVLKKKEIGQRKFVKEERALRRIVRPLREGLQNELRSLWIDYERKFSREGELVQELNGVEALLQSIEYFGTDIKKSGTTWWESTEEVVHDPLLVRFLETIHDRVYEGKRRFNPEGLGSILSFLGAIGTLKKTPRKGWVVRNVKSPETLGNHTFMLAMMTWVILRDKKLSRLDENAVMKMALCHLLPHVFVPQTTPYDAELQKTKNAKERKLILSKWVRNSMQEKKQFLGATKTKGERAIEKLTKGLEDSFREDVLRSWREFCENRTPEAHFVNQIYVLELLLQALQYWAKDKKFPIQPWWEWAFELADSEFLAEFVEDMKQRFHIWEHTP